MQDPFRISLNRKTVPLIFLSIVITLACVNAVMLVLYFKFGDRYLGIINYFDFGVEGNIPTIYSAFALLFCSMLLAIIAHMSFRKVDRNRYHWIGLALIFLFLAFDEGAQFHEKLGSLMERFMVAEGYFYYLWVIPYSFALAIFCLFYYRFLKRLPRQISLRMILSAFLFLTGALGLEIISAAEVETMVGDDYTILYCFYYSVEELLEMLGVVLFLSTLLEYLHLEMKELSIQF